MNRARKKDEQNLVAFPYQGKILYRSCQNINPGQELLVRSDEEHAQGLDRMFDYLVNQKCSAQDGINNTDILNMFHLVLEGI